MSKESKTYDERIAEMEAELARPVEIELTVDWGNNRIPIVVEFGKGKKDGHAKLTQAKIAEIKKVAVERALERQRRLRTDLHNLRQQAKAMQAILDKKGDITFAEFAMIYAKHVEGTAIIPGFELVPQRGSYRYRYGRSYYETDKLYRALEASKLVGWDRANEPKPTEDGALATKKLKELTPEDCFLRIVDDGYGGKRRVPNDTTLHSWVRKVLGAAVTVGVLDDNPASLKQPKEKKVVTARSAAAELQRVMKEGSDEPSRSVH